jgi:DNA mismatch endonuclease, patch repair protein
MPDNLTPDQRRRCMQSIKSRDTSPELLVRRHLHRLGFRFRLNVANLAGKPDIVLARFKTVIFVHGCFWHSHNCSRAVTPKSRASYWIPKLANTQKRDSRSKYLLKKGGWKVITFWECELNNRQKIEMRCYPLLLLRKKLARKKSRRPIRQGRERLPRR